LKEKSYLLKQKYLFICDNIIFKCNPIPGIIISLVYSLGTVLSALNDLGLSIFGLAGRLPIGYQFISIYGG